MSSHYPPGVTGAEPQIIGTDDVGERVFGWLSSRPTGSSVQVIARGLGLGESEVARAVDTLVEEGNVRVVRRTRSSTLFWGVDGEGVGVW